MYKKIISYLNKYQGSNTLKAFHLAISQSFIAFLFIFIDFIFSKRLSVSDFGVWKETFFIMNLGIPFLSFGFTESFKYFIAKENKDILFFFQNLTFVIFRIALILFVALAIVNILHYLTIINIGVYYINSLFFPLPLLAFLFNKTLRYIYINLGKAELLTKLSFFGGIFSLIVLVAGWYLLAISIEYYVSIAVVSYFSVFLFPSLFYYKSLGLPINFFSKHKATVKKMWVYGFPLYLATFSGLFSSYLDKFIVNIFENEATFAIFAVGAFEIPIFAMLSAAFSQQIFPKMVQFIGEGKEYEAKDLWLQTTKKVSYITYPIILLTMYFAEDIIFFIYNDSYQESVVLFKTYLLVLLFRNNSYGILLTAKGKTKLITKISFVVLITNIICSLVLYNFYGIQGVVFGTLLSTFLMWVIYIYKEQLFMEYLKTIILNKVLLILQLLIFLIYIL
ncbi:hypothetical protein [Dokdonia sp. R78006]|uniref:hypothetical protein n=1 Tax=Dokdonia sp. R78006 TaxID=3093866 RepID=UPI0036D33909